MRLKQIFASIILAVLALGFVAAPPAQAADRIRIVYGHLAMTQDDQGFLAFDGAAWDFGAEAWKEYCATIANAGASSVRIFPEPPWGGHKYGRRSQFCPFVLDPATNKWDLSRFNDWYFPILRQIVEIANSYNLEVWIPWFDSCEVQRERDGSPKPWGQWSPWIQNIQGVSHFYDAKADPYARAWVKRLVKEMAGRKVFWPWGNELGSNRYPEWARRVIFPLVRELGIPYDRMTYGAVMGEAPYLGEGKFGDASTPQDTARKFFGEDFPPESNKFKILREVHACGRPAADAFTTYGLHPAQAAYWWGGKPVGKFVLSDDGVHEWPNPKDGGRPDSARWKAMATWALQYSNLGGLEHCPEGGDLEYQAGVVAAIGAAYHAKFGTWPVNYGKWHYEPPPPPPDPEPEPEPDPEPPPPPPPDPQPQPEVHKAAWWIAPVVAVLAAIAYLIGRKK